MSITVSDADLRTVLDQRVMHCHLRDGHWDSDGRPCQECAARGRLYAALGDACIECGETFEPGDRITPRARWTPTGPIHADTCVWDEPAASTGRAVETPLTQSPAPVADGDASAAHPAAVPPAAATCPSTPGSTAPNRLGVGGHLPAAAGEG